MAGVWRATNWSLLWRGYSRDMVMVHNGLDISKPILTWGRPRRIILSPPAGVSWCPWQELLLFLSTIGQAGQDVKSGVWAQAGLWLWIVRVSVESCIYSSNCMLHCSKSRKVVEVGNIKGWEWLCTRATSCYEDKLLETSFKEFTSNTFQWLLSCIFIWIWKNLV